MSSYKKRQKALKRTHRERGQVHSRQHLGLLEKRKDYVLRAKDYARKKAELKNLHEKARNRNPDEFYYKMIKNKLKDKRHIIAQEEEKYSPEELQLLKTQDEKYVQMKLATETKKAERLKSCLHHTKLMKKNPPNTHIVFVDSREEAEQYKVTHKAKAEEPSKAEGTKAEDKGQSGRNACYKELNQRMQRCKQLSQAALKMKTQKDLMGKGKRIKIKGDGTRPPTYKWKQERQK